WTADFQFAKRSFNPGPVNVSCARLAPQQVEAEDGHAHGSRGGARDHFNSWTSDRRWLNQCNPIVVRKNRLEIGLVKKPNDDEYCLATMAGGRGSNPLRLHEGAIEIQPPREILVSPRCGTARPCPDPIGYGCIVGEEEVATKRLRVRKGQEA